MPILQKGKPSATPNVFCSVHSSFAPLAASQMNRKGIRARVTFDGKWLIRNSAFSSSPQEYVWSREKDHASIFPIEDAESLTRRFIGSAVDPVNSYHIHATQDAALPTIGRARRDLASQARGKHKFDLTIAERVAINRQARKRRINQD